MVVRLRLSPTAQRALVFLSLAVVTAPVAAAGPMVELLAETDLPGLLEVDRTLVGGLSGLTYDPGCDLFYAISDDRGSLASPRFYTLEIRYGGGAVEAKVLGATVLRGTDGAPFRPGEIDPEALALDANGDLFLASEGIPHRAIDPMVGRFRLDGTLGDILDLPRHFIPDAGGTRGVRDNLGFEGLALSPDGSRLFVAAENALIQDGPVADRDRSSPARILAIEPASGRPLSEHIYEVGPVPDEPRPASAFRTNGISEILALDSQQLLVVERAFSAGVGNQVRIYLADLGAATDVLDLESLLDDSVPRPTPRPIRKTLVADLMQLGVEPDNIEGMALGPELPDGRRMLLLVADNNFQPDVQRNQILLLAVSGVTSRAAVDRPVVGIHDIQGAAHVSPLVGRCVSRVEGLVTAVLGSRGGQAFWIQSSEPGDDDARTSEGLLVTAVDGLPTVEVGNLVRLDGRVEERSWGFELPVTRLFVNAIEIVARRRSLPLPVVIGEGGVGIPQPDVASLGLATFDPGRYAADALESLEGMLVQVEEPVVVGPTSDHGEVVVLADRGRSAIQRTTRGGLRLLDDNPNPQRIIIDDRLVHEVPDLRVGDALTGPVQGVLHYSFGAFKLLNIEILTDVRRGELEAERTELVGNASHLTVATFNLENLSAVSDASKFADLATIITENLAAPDILAVQEVQDDSGPEDDGTVSAARTLERLVAAIEDAGGPGYATRAIDPSDGADGGQPGANIRNAFLFNPTRVEFVDRASCPSDFGTELLDGPTLTCSPGLVDPGSPAFAERERGRGGSRKPLAGEFRFAGRPVFVVNLHLSSKGGDDPIFGRRQPRVETTLARRVEQSLVVAEFVEGLLSADPSARVVVLGDLNDFEGTDALRALEAVGLEDLVKRLPIEDRYTYVYLGNSQVLDHVLVSWSLAGVAEVETVHVNAEFPASDHASDHDPVIARFSFER